MPTQIELRNERADTMGGQTNTAPGGACNTESEGLTTTPTVKEHVMADLSLSVSDAHKRNQLALSILSHRDPTPETVAVAVAALKGESLPSLTLRGA